MTRPRYQFPDLCFAVPSRRQQAKFAGYLHPCAPPNGIGLTEQRRDAHEAQETEDVDASSLRRRHGEGREGRVWSDGRTFAIRRAMEKRWKCFERPY